MNILKLNFHRHHHCHRHSRFRHSHQVKLCPDFRSIYFPTREQKLKLLLSSASATPFDYSSNYNRPLNLHDTTPFPIDTNDEKEEFEEYLAEDGEAYQKTLRLVECAMFAAVSGLAFLLSNSLAIEKYFACFFALPIVLSTMRWGIAAGRKTMVATFVLLFILSGPVKAMTYLLLHGLLGFAMGTIWSVRTSQQYCFSWKQFWMGNHNISIIDVDVSGRLKASWGASVFLCSIVRAMGALCNVLIGSYLLGENILALITINVHALFTYILSSMGIIAVPSMNLIYFIFGLLLLLNCASFVFLLHLLYAVFFTRLGMKTSLKLPKWLEAAI